MVAVAGAVVGGRWVTQLQGVTYLAVQKIPALGGLLAFLPKDIDLDVTTRNALALELLKPSTDLTRSVAVGVSHSSTPDPELILAGSFQSGLKLDLRLEGIPGTLLNQPQALVQTQVVVNDRVGRTGILKLASGGTIPQGKYRLSVVESDDQSETNRAELARIAALPGTEKKIIVRREVFLGGAEDARYQNGLKKYLEKVRELATKELGELKQLSSTLESLFQETQSKYEEFQKPKRGMKKGQRRTSEWNAFHEKWQPMFTELQSGTSAWTPEALTKDRYYDGLYLKLQQLVQSAERVHAAQMDFFAPDQTTAADTLAVKVGSESEGFMRQLSEFKSLVASAEAQMGSGQALPGKQGL